MTDRKAHGVVGLALSEYTELCVNITHSPLCCCLLDLPPTTSSPLPVLIKTLGELSLLRASDFLGCSTGSPTLSPTKDKRHGCHPLSTKPGMSWLLIKTQMRS